MNVETLKLALQSANVTAFLRCIRHGESTQDNEAYRWLFGSTAKSPKLFESFADHPRVRTYEKYDGQFIKNGKIDFTTAAGAYQIVESTWDPVAKKYGLVGFAPHNQDIAACALIAGRGALDDVIAGRFAEALTKCRKEWASLPGALYGQPTKTLASMRSVYEEYGGKYYTAQTSVKPITVPSNPPAVPPIPIPIITIKEPKIMAPFIIPALTALMQVVPDLMKLFGSGSKSAERNTKAVETVVNLAKSAVGAVNEQQLIEAVQNDPAAVAQVQQAIRENWYAIQEVGGGISAAREAAAKVQGDKSLLANPAFIISLLLLGLPIMLLVDVFFVHPENYGSDGLRTQIVTGVLMVISMIGGFWLGTSFSSSKKDDAIVSAMK